MLQFIIQNPKNVTIYKSKHFTKNEIFCLHKAFSNVENLELIRIQNKPNIKAIKFFGQNYFNLFPLSLGTLIKIKKRIFYGSMDYL